MIDKDWLEPDDELDNEELFACENTESKRLNENFESKVLKKNFTSGTTQNSNNQQNNNSNLMQQNTETIQSLLDKLKGQQ